MKRSGVIAALLVLGFAASGFGQGPTLEEKVRTLFLQELRMPDLLTQLRQLGDDTEIVSTLDRLSSRNRQAKEGTPDFLVLNVAVASLGELRAKSANELLSSLLSDRKVHENVRALAARALGLIDPEANKQALMKALDPSEHLQTRIYAGEGLAKTKDAAALKALERYGREEKDSHVRQQFEKASQALRAKGVKPS